MKMVNNNIIINYFMIKILSKKIFANQNKKMSYKTQIKINQTKIHRLRFLHILQNINKIS